MKNFLIETREMVDPKEGWKTIAEVYVPAHNVVAALAIIERNYTKNQYIHKVILSKPL